MKKLILGFIIATFIVGGMVSIVRAEENPFIGALTEIISWTRANSLGISGFYSDKKMIPLAAVQLGKTKHDWLHAGVVSPLQEEFGLGVNVAFNFAKVIEKVKGKPLVLIQHLDIGYTVERNFSKGQWEKGIFCLFIKKDF